MYKTLSTTVKKLAATAALVTTIGCGSSNGVDDHQNNGLRTRLSVPTTYLTADNTNYHIENLFKWKELLKAKAKQDPLTWKEPTIVLKDNLVKLLDMEDEMDGVITEETLDKVYGDLIKNWREENRDKYLGSGKIKTVTEGNKYVASQ